MIDKKQKIKVEKQLEKFANEIDQLRIDCFSTPPKLSVGESLEKFSKLKSDFSIIIIKITRK